MNPITASASVCAISSTPLARIPSPPTPVSAYGAPASRSALATPAPCKSPDASPVTNMISRTGSARRQRQRALDVGDDLQRHGQCFAARLAGHGNRRLSAYRGEKALELEGERVALLRL